MYVAGIYVSPANYNLVGLGFAFTITALVFIALRIFTRVWIVRSFGVDDALIAITGVSIVYFLEYVDPDG